MSKKNKDPEFDTSSYKIIKNALVRRNPKTGKLELTLEGKKFNEKMSFKKSR